MSPREPYTMPPEDVETMYRDSALRTTRSAARGAAKRAPSMVYRIIDRMEAAGDRGETPWETVAAEGWNVRTVAGRYSDLWSCGCTRPNGQTRSRTGDGSNAEAVMVLACDPDEAKRRIKRYNKERRERSPTAALRARIEELEAENADLRRRLGMLPATTPRRRRRR